MATAANILSQHSIKHAYSSTHTVTILHTAWLQQPTLAYIVATAANISIHHGYSSQQQHASWLQLPTYCHNTVYSKATAAKNNMHHGYSSQQQHTSWLQQPITACNMATAAQEPKIHKQTLSRRFNYTF